MNILRILHINITEVSLDQAWHYVSKIIMSLTFQAFMLSHNRHITSHVQVLNIMFGVINKVIYYVPRTMSILYNTFDYHFTILFHVLCN